MPELPEVEVTRAGLADRLRGAQVRDLWLGKPLRWPLGCPPERLKGCWIGNITRRGKYLWMPTCASPPGGSGQAPDEESGRQDSGGLLIHLGMSGALTLYDDTTKRGKHDHFELQTDRGLLRLTDPRRFGAVVWSDALDAPPASRLLARLGPEPFDPALTPTRFHAALQARRSPIKSALLAGDLVVGAGNIYASEALFRAGIDPRQRCDRLSRPRAERLLAAVREVLSQAIALGGSTLRDFHDSHGMAGAYQQQAMVYARAGQPCMKCGAVLRRIVQGQRATYFCPRCQRR